MLSETYLAFSGRTSLIVRVGGRGRGTGALVNGTNAPSPDGPPICKSNTFRLSEPNKLNSGFGMVGLLGPVIK